MEDEIVIYLVVNDSLKMSPGKIAAQCGHAVQSLIYNKIIQNSILIRGLLDCLKTFPKIVLKTSLEEWNKLKEETKILPYCTLIIDEGRTEVPPNSETVIGIGPIIKNSAKSLVGHLKLL